MKKYSQVQSSHNLQQLCYMKIVKIRDNYSLRKLGHLIYYNHKFSRNSEYQIFSFKGLFRIKIIQLIMKLSVFLIVCFLALLSNCRRVFHTNHSALLHQTEENELEKKIFRDVLTDKEISQLIADSKTNTPEFKKTITKKTLTIIGHNDQYLKPLSQKLFSNSKVSINDDEKLKVLQLALKDDNLTTLIAQNKSQEEIIKRGGQLISQDKPLLQTLANQVLKENQVGKQLSDQQRNALLRIYLNNPECLQKGTVSQEGVKEIIKQIQNDNDLKEFFSSHRDQFIEKLVKSI